MDEDGNAFAVNNVLYCVDCVVKGFKQSQKIDRGEISDGYHTFNELYAHRFALFRSLCKAAAMLDEAQGSLVITGPWMSRLHHDGSTLGEDYFIAGVEVGRKQISYHWKVDRCWDALEPFCEVLPLAPEWDGHTADDVVNRLLGW